VTEEQNTGLLDRYNAMFGSFAFGLMRLTAARATSLTCTVVLLQINSEAKPDPANHPYESVLRELLSISFPEFDAFRYITNTSYLVYATTLLDTFLADTSREAEMDEGGGEKTGG
jgi:hypothetical protein